MTLPGQKQARDHEILRRRERVLELREEGMTFREISAEMGVSLGLVHKDFEASITRVLEPNVTAYRAEHTARLAKMRAVTQDILDRRHVVVSASGRLALDMEGEPIEDDSIVLAAMDRLHKIDEAERKLLGLDVRPEVQITGTLAYEITGLGSGDGSAS